MELCDLILQTNKVRCALNMEILDLPNEESISVAELVYKFDKKSYCECLSIAKVRFKFFFRPQACIYIIWTPAPITLTPLALRVRGNYINSISSTSSSYFFFSRAFHTNSTSLFTSQIVLIHTCISWIECGP